MALRVLYLGMKWDYGDRSRGFSFEEMSFHAALKAHPGVEVTHFDYVELHKQLGKEAMNERLVDFARSAKYDCLFCVMFEQELDPTAIEAVSAAGVTTIAWGCDDHWRFDNFSQRWAPHFDWWVTTANSAVQKFKDVGYDRVIKSQWAVEPSVYYPLDLTRDIDISFVGMPHGARAQVLQWLAGNGVSLAVFGFGWAGLQSRITHDQMIEVFSRSKVCLNMSNASTLGEQQIKGRVFEVPGCRGFLLTDMADDLGSYYEIGREVVVFDGPDDLLGKIRHYVAHDEERESIARAGYERTLKEHTWRNRFDAIFEAAGLA